MKQMTNITLSEVVEFYSERCGNPHLTVYDVSGVNRDKEFFEPSKQVGDDTSNYQVVPPHYFACNLMHVGRDMVLPISQNHTDKNKYVSPAYTVFRIKENDFLLDDYLFMILKSKEKDRYFWFHTDSSVRDGMSWEDFSSIEIPLPGIEVQREYVAVYKAMQHNLQTMQTKLDDLKLVCDGYIENLRKQYPCEKIGEYITEVDERNTDRNVLLVQGVDATGSFCETKADMTGIDICKYKVVRQGSFAYNPSRINIGSISINLGEDCIVSPMYQVFKVVDENKLSSRYLQMWLSRKEFFRSTLFYAVGSVRDTFDLTLMCEVRIPIPPIDVQRSIVAIYDVYNKRKQYAERMRQQINEVCPVLVAGAMKERVECLELSV